MMRQWKRGASDMAVRALNLCDGYGGFERALRPFGVRTVARVERDSYAAAVLVERMEEARLDQAPIWDDLTTFDGAAWRGRVDLITAGFPCQPFSAAGNRRGLDDPRWLWPYLVNIIRDVGPRWVVLENVPGLLKLGLPEVLADLASFGFDAEWGLFSAAAIGAPHKRERLWILGHAGGEGRSEVAGDAPGDEGPHGRQSDGNHVALRAVEDVGYAPRVGWYEGHRPAARDRWSDRVEAAACWPPGRDDDAGWREWIEAGGPQPVVRRDTDGPPAGLADALHLGGNGLVPQCATEAIAQLLARAGWVLT